MNWLNILIARLRGLLRREAVIEDIDEELRLHVELEMESNIERGMPPEEARRAALRSFGNMGRIKDMAYEIRGGGILDTLWQDLRFGLRMLLKHKGFTLVAVVTLALGIGANTAIFSVVNGVLLQPLPYPDPDRIITIWEPSRDGHTLGLTDVEFFYFHEQNRVFEEVAAYATGATNLTGDGNEPARVLATWASAGFFDVVGVKPALGRAFVADDDKPGAAQVAVLSHGLWQRRFGSDPNIIGRQVSLNGRSRTIIGVMPRGFEFDDKEVELWLPLGLDRADLNPGARSYSAIARLKPLVTLEQARAEMNALAAQLAEDSKKRYTDAVNTTQSLNLIPLYELIVGDVRPALLIMLAAIGFVLLIACANVANLLLARAETRQKEIAIRIAIGAGRLRIIQQLLMESIVLSVLGGAMGLLLAIWGVGALVAIAPASIPRTNGIGIDGMALVFTLSVSLLAGIIFGLAPALQSSKPDLDSSLKEGGRHTTGVAGRRTRRILVKAEIALALVLLVGAGLMLKSFWRLLNTDSGFDPKNVLTARITLPESKYPQQQQVDAFYEQLLERIRALPGVQSAATVTYLPLSGFNSNASFEIEGRPRASEGSEQNADYRMISEDYFRTMGIALVRGRSFEGSDQEDAPGVVIINETMAHRFWPDEDPLGKRINLGVPGSPWLTIVGIVRDVKQRGLDDRPKPMMHFLHSQNAYSKGLGIWRQSSLVIRTASEPLALSSAVKSAVQTMDKDLPVARIQTMQQVLDRSVSQPRFTMLLLVMFAVVALLLAAVGVYGVMAYSVTQRTHEIGIRMALGARRSDVIRLIVGQGIKLALVGVGLGMIGAFALTRVISSLLYNVSPTDPAVFAGVSVLLTMVSLLACFVPALRATRVDPVIALRDE
ncbi:MAG TPA: ABC transporter permease [Pyrinomonadaceae bacterium]|jgi:putative ABC transport system permease protein|nr:ABC transporter permease [Pyrinomonadaceae bacterium]